MKSVLAIDPGPKKSAFVWWDGSAILAHSIVANEQFEMATDNPVESRDVILVIEQIKSYGMKVSDSVFDTVFWSGRFAQYWDDVYGDFYRLPRMEVKMHLCHDSRAKDSNIRQALIDRFEPDLLPKQRPKGILQGISADEWAALAVAVTWYDQNIGQLCPRCESKECICDARPDDCL